MQHRGIFIAGDLYGRELGEEDRKGQWNLLDDTHNHNWLGSENGVAIILSPTLTEAYDRAGRSKPITTGSDSVENFYGRFIGIWLSFPNINPYGKKIKGELKIFLASAHHPNDPLEYEEFNDKLAELLLEAEPYDRNLAEIMLEVDSPYKSSCRLIGHNINANVGARDCEEIKCKLGPNSIDNLDTKGILARNFMLSQNLRVLNTYFRHRRHTVKVERTTYLPVVLSLDRIQILCERNR